MKASAMNINWRLLGFAAAAVGTLLDQLDVVVAERPEECLRPFQRPGVVVALERLRRRAHQLRQRDLAPTCEHDPSIPRFWGRLSR